MSQLTLWLVERQLNSKTPMSRLQAVCKLRALADIECLPLLEQALTNSDVEVRREAVLALGDLHDETILPILLRALKDQADVVQETVIAQLKRLGHRDAIAGLVNKLSFGSEAVRWRAAAALESLSWQPKSVDEQIKFFIALGKFDRLVTLGDRAIKALAEVLRDAPTERRLTAASILGQMGDPDVLPPLFRALKDSAAQLRTAAAYALARTRLPEAIPPLIAALRDGDRNVRVALASALGSFRDPAAVEPLIALLEDKDWEVRTAALEALGKSRDSRAAAPVAQQMDDLDPDVREFAADALGRVGDDSVLEKLVMTSVDENIGVRQAAVRALQRVDPNWHRSERVQRLLPKLQAALKNKDASVQLAASGLIQLVSRSTENQPLKIDATLDTEKLKTHTLTRVLQELLRDPDPACRCVAAEAIAQLKLDVPVDFLALAELKHTDVEEIFLASFSGETWFERDCRDATIVRRLLAETPRQATALTSLITLGDFKRLELHTDRNRTVVVASADRNLCVRAKNSAPTLTALTAPVSGENLADWLRQTTFIQGALVRAIRFADASVACDLDSRAFPASQLEQAFRNLSGIFSTALPDGQRPTRLVWHFERAGLHCVRRADGALLGIFTTPKDADLAGIEKQLREFSATPATAVAA